VSCNRDLFRVASVQAAPRCDVVVASTTRYELLLRLAMHPPVLAATLKRPLLHDTGDQFASDDVVSTQVPRRLQRLSNACPLATTLNAECLVRRKNGHNRLA
jgi:hypothetical protein